MIGAKASGPKNLFFTVVILAIPLFIVGYVIGALHKKATDKKIANSSQHLESGTAFNPQQSGIVEQQTLLSDLKSQKELSTKQADQMKIADEALASDLKQLGKTKERLTAVEKMLAGRSERISELEKQLQVSEADLAKEQQAKQALSAELSSKDVEIKKLEKELENTQSITASLNDKITKSKRRIEKLQAQLSNLIKTESIVGTAVSETHMKNTSDIIPLKSGTIQGLKKSSEANE